MPSVLWHCWLVSRKGIRSVKNGGWSRWALVSPNGVAPSRMVGVSASVNLPLHHKVKKFSSGTSSPGWSGHKTVVVVVKLWKVVNELIILLCYWLSDCDHWSCAGCVSVCLWHRERCLLGLQQALESNSNRLSSLAVAGMQVTCPLFAPLVQLTFFYWVAMIIPGWSQCSELSLIKMLVAWSSGRALVFGRRAFAVLRSTCSWWVTTYVGKPSAIGQPTRPTQPFILSGLING